MACVVIETGQSLLGNCKGSRPRCRASGEEEAQGKPCVRDGCRGGSAHACITPAVQDTAILGCKLDGLRLHKSSSLSFLET